MAATGRKIEVEVDELIRTRESLVSGLSNISNALNEFVRSYVQHTNKWVGTEASLATGVELAGMANLFTSSSSGAAAPLTVAINAAGEAPVDKKSKKEKKPRKQKDPNAPKRPLTAYFLYTMSARPVVKQDFVDNGQTPTAQEISDEILKRWNEMTEHEKNGWKQIYEKNAEKYREEVKEYLEKTGKETAASDLTAHADDVVVGVQASDADDREPTTATPVSKPKRAPSKKKKDAVAGDAASPSAQLVSRSTVPLPNPSKPAEAATSAPKSSKRKSTAASSGDKSEDPAPKRKRRTKAEIAADNASRRGTVNENSADDAVQQETPAATSQEKPKAARKSRKSAKSADGS